MLHRLLDWSFFLTTVCRMRNSEGSEKDSSGLTMRAGHTHADAPVHQPRPRSLRPLLQTRSTASADPLPAPALGQAPPRPARQPTPGYMNLKWIAQRLHMGSWTYVSNLLKEQPPTPPLLERPP